MSESHIRKQVDFNSAACVIYSAHLLIHICGSRRHVFAARICHTLVASKDITKDPRRARPMLKWPEECRQTKKGFERIIVLGIIIMIPYEKDL